MLIAESGEVLLVGEGQCMETYGVSSNTELPVWTPVCK